MWPNTSPTCTLRLAEIGRNERVSAAAVYGIASANVMTPPSPALRISPVVQGALEFQDLENASLDRIDVHAPGNRLERGYVLAQAVRRLRPGGQLNAIARKDRAGLRLRRELECLGLQPEEEVRRGHRICRCIVGSGLNQDVLEAAITAGDIQYIPDISLWSQPGLFSWDRLDAGTSLLITAANGLAGVGAEFGCGAGALGREILRSPAVSKLILIDNDARAVRASQRNIADARASFRQWDLRSGRRPVDLQPVDFIVTNPPFHFGGESQVALGRAFIEAGRHWLSRRGRLLLVANVTLPYEQTLRAHFRETHEIARTNAFKVLEARA